VRVVVSVVVSAPFPLVPCRSPPPSDYLNGAQYISFLDRIGPLTTVQGQPERETRGQTVDGDAGAPADCPVQVGLGHDVGLSSEENVLTDKESTEPWADPCAIYLPEYQRLPVGSPYSVVSF
jgi:hypothetical protein